MPLLIPKNAPWYAHIIEFIVVASAIIATLMVMATDPDWDEVQKGISSAVVLFITYFLGTYMVGKLRPTPKD